MLTIHFPKAKKNFLVSSDYNHQISVNFESGNRQLYIDAQFDGYSYYLEGAVVNAYREIQLLNETLVLASDNVDEVGHELAGHSDENDDLLIKKATLSFKKSKNGFIKVDVHGVAVVLEDKNNNTIIQKQLEKSQEAYPYSVNPEIQVQTDEFFTAMEAEKLFHWFIFKVT